MNVHVRDSRATDSYSEHVAQVSSSQRVQSIYTLARELFIDVHGSLIPGLLFTVVASALVIASGMCFLRAFGPKGQVPATLDMLLRSPIDVPHAWFLLIVGYVVGGVFQRQDPKRPDQRSLERILRKSSSSDLERSAVQLYGDWTPVPTWYWRTRRILLEARDWIGRRFDFTAALADGRVPLVKAAIIAASPGAQFPYSHMYEYLDKRGLTHLAGIVAWTGQKDQERRTKMFLNVLKIRLQLAASEKCGEIVRNEAHVRMMSSVWYAARAVFGVCCLSVLVVLAAILQAGRGAGNSYHQDLLVYSAMVSFAVVSSRWLKRHVENYFHYQRVREVVYVLETAFSVSRSGHPEILEDLPRQ